MVRLDTVTKKISDGITAFVSGAYSMTNKTMAGTTNNVESEALASTVAFRVRRGTPQGLNNNNWNKILFATELFDLGGDFDNGANSRFTAPVKGIYCFSSAIHISGVANGDRALLALNKNGTEEARGQDMICGAGEIGVTVNTLLNLNANDYIDVQLYLGSASGKNTVGGSGQLCYFTGFLIGKY